MLTDPSAQRVTVRGSWNQWGQPLVCVKGDEGLWFAFTSFNPGSYSYVFVIDDVHRIADADNSQSSSDNFGGPASLFVIAGSASSAPTMPVSTPPVTPNPVVVSAPDSPATAPELAVLTTPAVTVDAQASETTAPGPAEGVVFLIDAPGAKLVDVMGSWNSWSTPTACVKGADGKWTVTIKIAAGSYEFKFRKDGDYDALNKDNRKLKVGADGKGVFADAPAAVVSPAATTPSPAVPATASGSLPAPPAGTDFAATPVVVTADGRVMFGYTDAYVGSVNIGADFNNFTFANFPLTKGADGIWRGVVTLKDGAYKWKFVVDGQWENGDNRSLKIIRGKGGNLEILPDVPTFNTLYNSKIYFSGRLYGRGVGRIVPDGEPTDTGRIRFESLEYDLMPRMSFTAGDKVTGSMEVDFNRDEGRTTGSFSEGDVTLHEKWGQLIAFRRKRVIDFNNPSRSLDLYRNTLNDGLYFTYEDRPPEHWFGRQFDDVRRSDADNEFIRNFQGWQGLTADVALGRYHLQSFASTHMLVSHDIWGYRSTWTSRLLKLGSTFVQSEKGRGVRAELTSNAGTSQQTKPVIDTGGFVLDPEGGNILNYDVLNVLTPFGHNRDRWWNIDAKLGWDTRFLFVEFSDRLKDWAFIALDSGTSVRPDGSNDYHNAFFGVNEGEYLIGGREKEQSVSFGGVYFPVPRLGLELNYKFEDGTALTLDRNNALVNVKPSAGTLTARGRYQALHFSYSFEAVHRTVRDFANTSFNTPFDEYDFVDNVNQKPLHIMGGDNVFRFKQELAINIDRWHFRGSHHYGQYEIAASSPLSSTELTGLVSYDLTARLLLALGGRVKSYSLPNTLNLTIHPGQHERFYSSNARAVYSISKYVKLNFGVGVDYNSDEDVEEGRLFFLRDALARARRATGGSTGIAHLTHTLDQVIDAERILSAEKRLELILDARF